MSKRTHHSNNHRSRGVFAGAVSALSLLAVTTQAVNAEQLTVKPGDTIWGLAKQHGLSVSALEQANPSVKKMSNSIDLITVGQQLTLPTIQHDNVDLNADGSYTVKPGDTLSSIADHYNVTVSQLMAWNNLGANDSLYIGQQLSVTGPATSTAVNAPVVNMPVSNESISTQQSIDQPTDTTSTVQTQTSVVASATAPQQATTSSQSVATSQATPTSSTTQQGLAASTVATPSQSTVNNSSATTANSTTSGAVAASATDNSATNATQPVSANNVQAASTTAENNTVPQKQSVAVSQAVSTDVNTAAYRQSFVQVASVASQTPQSQNVPASQATAVTSQAQLQQSQAAASQPAQQGSTTSQDLQHGSVVSLATKIANSNSVPYVWGGESLSGMDCSGLVKYVYANAEGKQLPHYTGALENCVDQHPVSEAKPGDLLFWGNHGATYHTAIYTGNNQYVAAAKPGTNVATYTISPYFNPSFAGTVK